MYIYIYIGPLNMIKMTFAQKYANSNRHIKAENIWYAWPPSQ